ncbi:hypothetical protein [Microbacterium esteraromaticum]|uniref:hypothetical protein n=1 Tax=Microbacterium esteraromaticum TaxID=57043 RepID=UPI00195DB916|nr:hypothetical protein [Microbacterium esteraromaticum]MBM7467375.1 hypothetical protein [Microbacterium esteraromaticum]
MSSDPDDDAPSWEGDAALDARRPAPHPSEQRATRPAPAPQGGDAAPSRDDQADVRDDESQGIGTATLVMLGILGGVYLLYTVGWVIGGVGMQAKAMFMLPAPLYLASMWIAALAPALWFVATLILTRGGRDWVRISALVVGAALLVPWPFVVAGGGGAL